MRVSREAVAQLGDPYDKPRNPPPAAGVVRMSFLAADGLYFGEGPWDQLARDAIGGPVLSTATELVRLIVGLPQRGGQP
jgi:hypothetical protein